MAFECAVLYDALCAVDNLHSLNFATPIATPVSSMQHRFRALRHFPSKDDRTLHRAALEKHPRMHERPRHSRAAGLCTRRLPVEPKAAPVARAGVIPGRATMASGDQSIRAGEALQGGRKCRCV